MFIKIKYIILTVIFYSCGIGFMTPSFAATPSMNPQRIAPAPVNPSHRAQLIHSKINLNTAFEKDLIGIISGIGKKRAAAIIAYRTQHGKFNTLSELAFVKKIGHSFYLKHADEIKRRLKV